MEGGSGRASVKSPASVTVKNGECSITLEWSSSNYDYMIVDGTKYLPVNQSGNSTFTFPIDGLNCEMQVIGDTIAMSTPHEVNYSLLISSATK